MDLLVGSGVNLVAGNGLGVIVMDLLVGSRVNLVAGNGLGVGTVLDSSQTSLYCSVPGSWFGNVRCSLQLLRGY